MKKNMMVYTIHIYVIDDDDFYDNDDDIVKYNGIQGFPFDQMSIGEVQVNNVD